LRKRTPNYLPTLRVNHQILSTIDWIELEPPLHTGIECKVQIDDVAQDYVEKQTRIGKWENLSQEHLMKENVGILLERVKSPLIVCGRVHVHRNIANQKDDINNQCTP